MMSDKPVDPISSSPGPVAPTASDVPKDKTEQDTIRGFRMKYFGSKPELVSESMDAVKPQDSQEQMTEFMRETDAASTTSNDGDPKFDDIAIHPQPVSNSTIQPIAKPRSQLESGSVRWGFGNLRVESPPAAPKYSNIHRVNKHFTATRPRFALDEVTTQKDSASSDERHAGDNEEMAHPSTPNTGDDDHAAGSTLESDSDERMEIDRHKSSEISITAYASMACGKTTVEETLDSNPLDIAKSSASKSNLKPDDPIYDNDLPGPNANTQTTTEQKSRRGLLKNVAASANPEDTKKLDHNESRSQDALANTGDCIFQDDVAQEQSKSTIRQKDNGAPLLRTCHYCDLEKKRSSSTVDGASNAKKSKRATIDPIIRRSFATSDEDGSLPPQVDIDNTTHLRGRATHNKHNQTCTGPSYMSPWNASYNGGMEMIVRPSK
ncbi:hypothetical protein BJ170DRAFT_732878 [Xylariales sp. AK1849]|nr:hypothetical protein BJ170DRAFT_732878 [Xylariales sp. AK1849]